MASRHCTVRDVLKSESVVSSIRYSILNKQISDLEKSPVVRRESISVVKVVHISEMDILANVASKRAKRVLVGLNGARKCCACSTS